jgi:hypothetical protein
LFLEGAAALLLFSTRMDYYEDRQTVPPVPKQDLIIWLERLASRCKYHGYAEKAAELRARADALNARLPEAERLAPDDERFSEPLVPGSVLELIRLVDEALEDPA